ncbi:TrmH family RNA methyltransferase [Trichothermofontia sp.]
MLTSLQNPLVKQLRKLQQAKERHRQQQFLLEGTHLLQEALAVGYPLSVVCCTPDWQSRYPSLWQQVNQQVNQQAARVELVSPEVLAAIATTVHPDGVVAVARQHQRPLRAPRRPSLGLLIDTLQDPGNLGTLIRTGVAAGAEGLWLSPDSVDPHHPKVLRASAGQWFRLPLTVVTDWQGAIADWQAQGIQIVASCATAPHPYWQVDFRLPTLILLGNEGAGLSCDLVAMADRQARIPHFGPVESLNVAIVAALMLYEVQRQRQLPGSGEG